MTTRTRNAIALLVAAAVITGAVVLLARSRAERPGPTAVGLIPADARIVVLANLVALRQSPFARFFRSDALPDPARGAGTTCDRDAFDRATEVAVWVPGDTPDQFGIAAIGAFVPQELVACSTTTIAKRGGHPSVRTEGEFTVVGDDDLGADAARIAARPDGLLLLGRPSVRTRMQAVGAGWSPSAATQGEHQRMRAALGETDLSVTAVVDASLRAAAQRFVGEGDSLLDGVRGLAIGTQTSSVVRIRAQVWCDTASACEAVKAGLEARRAGLAASIPMRAAGIAALADSMAIELAGTTVSVRLESPAGQLADLIDRVSRWADQQSVDRTAPTPAGTVVPDEVLRPSSSAAAPASSK